MIRTATICFILQIFQLIPSIFGQEVVVSLDQDKVKFFMATDRYMYFPGDVIHFSSWVLHDTTTYIKYADQIELYLADSSDAVVISGAFPLIRDASKGELLIPQGIIPGIYRLIAFYGSPASGKCDFFQKHLIITGHENYQELHHTDYEFNDKKEIRTQQDLQFIYKDNDTLVQFCVRGQKNDLLPRTDYILDICLDRLPPKSGASHYTLSIWSESTLKDLDQYEEDEMFDFYTSFSDDFIIGSSGKIKTAPVDSLRIITLALPGAESEAAYTYKAWISPQDTLLTGLFLVGIKDKPGCFNNALIKGNTFLELKVPPYKGNIDLQCTFYVGQKSSKFTLNPFLYSNYLPYIPKLTQTAWSDEFKKIVNQKNKSVQLIAEAYRNWGINLKSHVLDSSEYLSEPSVIPLKNPDISIPISDYEAERDLVSFIRDQVPQLRIRESNKGIRLHFSILYRSDLSTSYAPTVFVNNLIIKDLDVIKNIPLSDVDCIDIYLKPIIIGNNFLPGIIAINLKSRATPPEVYVENVILREISGFAPKYQERMPGTCNKYPDVRQTLIWVPDLDLTQVDRARIKYRTSDLSVPIKLKISGTTAEGRPIIHQEVFRMR